MEKGLTVALVVLDEEKNLSRVLHSLLPQEPHPFAWEILLIDNGSCDGTLPEFRKFRDEHPGIACRWISSGVNNLGRSRNLALTEAKYHVVGFIDADCTAPVGWMAHFYNEITRRESSESRLLAIGGGNVPPGAGHRFQQALCVMFSSWLGSLNTIQARPPANAREVFHLPTCNAFYLRARALAAGGFSPHYADVCEDLEFSWRATTGGYRFFYLPGLDVIHHHKPEWNSWARKMFRYGRGQIKVSRAYPWHLWGVKGLPLLFSLVAALWFFFDPLAATLAALAYLGFLGAFATNLCFARRRLDLAPQVFLLMATTQIFYSLGELWGVCQLSKSHHGKMH